MNKGSFINIVMQTYLFLQCIIGFKKQDYLLLSSSQCYPKCRDRMFSQTLQTVSTQIRLPLKGSLIMVYTVCRSPTDREHNQSQYLNIRIFTLNITDSWLIYTLYQYKWLLRYIEIDTISCLL